MNHFMFLALSIVLGASGQVLLKMGVNRIGSINLAWPQTLVTLMDVFTNVWILSGILCFVSSMILWLKVISSMELSTAYPTVSVSYIIVFILSVFLFNETVSIEKVMGLVFVAVGVYPLVLRYDHKVSPSKLKLWLTITDYLKLLVMPKQKCSLGRGLGI